MPVRVKRFTAVLMPSLVVAGMGLALLTSEATGVTFPPLPRGGFGSVTGYLDACSGLPLPPLASPHGAGTVTVLAGRIRWIQLGPGQWRESLPTTVLAEAHVTPQLPFQFILRAGDYVLVGNYGEGSNVRPAVPVVIGAGRSLLLDIPDACK